MTREDLEMRIEKQSRKYPFIETRMPNTNLIRNKMCSHMHMPHGKILNTSILRRSLILNPGQFLISHKGGAQKRKRLNLGREIQKKIWNSDLSIYKNLQAKSPRNYWKKAF